MNRPPRMPVLVVATICIGFLAGWFWVVSPNMPGKTAPADAAGENVKPSQTPTPVATNGVQQEVSPAELQQRALTTCQSLLTAQIQTAIAADMTIEQWRLHLQAMNLLVAGQITLEQATGFWMDSEKDAKHRIHAFLDEWEVLRDAGGSCPTAAPKRCVRAVREQGDVLSVADVAAETWLMHIHGMNRLMRGEVSVEQAITAWHHMWHMGQRQIVSYDRQVEQATGLGCA